MKINDPAATLNAGVLAEALTAWKRAFDQHRPEDMVRLFSRDALFQGLSPTLLTGRKEIFDYFDALPPVSRQRSKLSKPANWLKI